MDTFGFRRKVSVQRVSHVEFFFSLCQPGSGVTGLALLLTNGCDCHIQARSLSEEMPKKNRPSGGGCCARVAPRPFFFASSGLLAKRPTSTLHGFVILRTFSLHTFPNPPTDSPSHRSGRAEVTAVKSSDPIAALGFIRTARTQSGPLDFLVPPHMASMTNGRTQVMV